MSQEQCNLCGCSEFVAQGSRERAKCKKCGSLERTRLLWMFLEEQPFGDATTVLHLAPERGLSALLKSRLKPGNYVCADVDPQRYAHIAHEVISLDLTRLDDQPSDAYDLIVHSHVMEHVPCNIAYSLFHLHRMLKPGGRQICVIPFLKGKYDECFQDIPEAESVRRFGQNDHVRRFGIDDVDRHLGAVVNLPAGFNAAERFGEDRLRRANVPEKAWHGFTVHTVLELKKDDFRLR